MAVTNTGIVERTIVGVNESDLFLDSEATSVTTNTGIVERSIVGVHDANFVHPIGDEEVLNGGFDTDTNWNAVNSNGVTISNGSLNFSETTISHNITQANVVEVGKNYKVTLTISNYIKGSVLVVLGAGGTTQEVSANGTFTLYGVASINTTLYIQSRGASNTTLSIDNVSVKEVLVTRESTTTNTGIVERAITGLNESELWLDAESTSVVNNTGIVERPITGVNESDPMFPDNTISNIVNIAGIISSLIADLKARATTFENEDATQNILINLQNC